MTSPRIEGPVTTGKGPFLAALTLTDDTSPYSSAEYFLDGSADAYEVAADGVAKPIASADYRTRVVVSYPTDATRFNGTVLVEWLNVSGGLDSAPDYTFLRREIMRSGYAWMGVSAQYVGVHGGPALMSSPNSVA